MKKKLLIGGGIAVVIAIVVLANLRGQKGDLSVDTVVIGHEDLVAEVNCSGTIQPQRSVDVSANAIGTITRLAVKEGQAVEQGYKIATVGKTGRATGPHLHFEIRKATKPRNPLFFLPRP